MRGSWTAAMLANAAAMFVLALGLNLDKPSMFHHAPPKQSRPAPTGMADRFLAKRLPAGARALPPDAYAKARAQMAKLPRYNIRAARFEASHAKSNAPAWEELGPRNIAGRTRSLVFDPRNPSRMWMGGVSGGVWFSDNAGASWDTTSDALNNINIGALAINPRNPDELFAGTGEVYRLNDRSYASMGGAGIFRSRNGGQSFHQLLATATTDFRYVSDLLVSPHDGARLYVATNTGIFISRDGGASFSALLKPVDGQGRPKYEGCTDLQLVPHASKDVLLASCASRSTDDRYWLPNTVTPQACGLVPCPATIYRNPDAGGTGTWSEVLTESGMGRVSMAMSRASDAIVYALAASLVPGFDRTGDGIGDYDNGLHAIYRSDDGGLTWEARLRNSGNELGSYILSHSTSFNNVIRACNWQGTDTPYSAGWYNQAIAVDPLNPDIVWAGGMDLYRSNDGARSFGKASYWWYHGESTAGVHSDVHALHFHPDYNGNNEKRLFVLNDGGLAQTNTPDALVRSDAQATCGPSNGMVGWADATAGLGTIQFYTGAVASDQSFWLGGAQDNGTLLFRNGFAARQWQHIYGGDGGQVAIDPRNSNVFYVSYQNGNIYRTDNGGVNFIDANNGINDVDIFIMPYLIDANAPDRLYAGGSRLWRTDNRGQSWRAVSASFGNDFGSRISALAVAPGNANRILIGNQRGIYRNNNATASTANTVWQGASPRAGWVSSLSFQSSDNNIAYATYASFGGDHVWQTRDGGVTWRAIDGSGNNRLPDVPTHSLVIDPNNPQRLFVGTDLGVFVSVDGGANWAVENSGFTNTIVEVLALGLANANEPARLYAFTYGRGAWRVPMGELDGQAAYRIDATATGTFYNAAQSGHGLMVQQIESSGTDQVLVAWFTYANGQQRWLIGQGEVLGDTIRAAMISGSGADFPPNFRSNEVQLRPWGELVLRYRDADHVEASWSTEQAGFASGALDFQRLTGTVRGNESAQARIGACSSGAWYNPTQSGHGVFAEVFEQNGTRQLLATWYVWQDGTQRWLIGSGPVQGDGAELSVQITSGANAPPNFDPNAVVRENWGTLRFTQIDANRARWQWNSVLSGYGSGEMDLVRLTGVKGNACQ